MHKVLVTPVYDTTCETFCHDCGQLRLWARPDPVKACGNCGSARIETGLIGCEWLDGLRAEWRKARGRG